jgi:hypothetical protein
VAQVVEPWNGWKVKVCCQKPHADAAQEVHVRNKKRADVKFGILLNPTWIEHATFWSGLRGPCTKTFSARQWKKSLVTFELTAADNNRSRGPIHRPRSRAPGRSRAISTLSSTRGLLGVLDCVLFDRCAVALRCPTINKLQILHIPALALFWWSRITGCYCTSTKFVKYEVK